MDNDCTDIMQAGSAWRAGYNLKDDDDNNDGKVDMRIRYYFAGSAIYRDWVVNQIPGAGWGQHVKKVADNVMSCTFSYFGSKSNELGENIDTGADGIPNTGDVGENDGIISPLEISKTLPPLGSGNGNTVLDTPSEVAYLTTISIKVQFDSNNDRISDFTIGTEITPPLMGIKALQL
jgi:hypothetical protein